MLPDTMEEIQDPYTPQDMVEEVVPEENVESAPVETAEEEVKEETEEHPVPNKRSGIARMKAKLEKAQQEIEFLRGHKEQAPVKAEAPAGRPKADNFSTYEEYEEARDEWVASEAVKRLKDSMEAKAVEDEMKQASRLWSERSRALEAKDPDFDEDEARQCLRDAGIVVSSAMAEAIYTSDAGPEMLKYLSDNIEEAQRIAGLTPAKAARELGRLEGRLVTVVESKPKPKSSQAPPPIVPVSGRATAHTPSRYERYEEF